MYLITLLSFSVDFYCLNSTWGRYSVDIFQGVFRHPILFCSGLVREVQQNPGKICRYQFPLGVCMVPKSKVYKTAIQPVNMLLVSGFYKLLLIIGYSIVLGRFELGDEFLDVFGVNGNFVECRSDEDFIFDNKH